MKFNFKQSAVINIQYSFKPKSFILYYIDNKFYVKCNGLIEVDECCLAIPSTTKGEEYKIVVIYSLPCNPKHDEWFAMTTHFDKDKHNMTEISKYWSLFHPGMKVKGYIDKKFIITEIIK